MLGRKGSMGRVLTLKHGIDGYGPEGRHQRAMSNLPVMLSWQCSEEAIVYRASYMNQSSGDSLFKALLICHLIEETLAADEDTFTSTKLKLEYLAYNNQEFVSDRVLAT